MRLRSTRRLLVAMLYTFLVTGCLPAPYRPAPYLQAHEKYEGYTLAEWIQFVESPDTRDAALVALERYGPNGVSAVPCLIKVLSRDKNRFHRRGATWALKAIGPGAVDAVPVLCKALNDSDDHVRVSAASALGEIGSKDKHVVEKLTNALRDSDFVVRLAAAGALGRIGPAAKSAIPELKRLERTDPSALCGTAWRIGDSLRCGGGGVGGTRGRKRRAYLRRLVSFHR